MEEQGASGSMTFKKQKLLTQLLKLEMSLHPPPPPPCILSHKKRACVYIYIYRYPYVSVKGILLHIATQMAAPRNENCDRRGYGGRRGERDLKYREGVID